MSKGFLLFAQNTDSIDYVKQAYALALSIKISQNSINNVSLVTNSKVPKKYRDIFDKIIPIPYFKIVENSPLQAEHRYQLYNACLLYTSPSPRDRTRSRMPSSA